MEKVFALLTAAFVGGSLLYFAGSRRAAVPYRVDVQYTAAAAAVLPAPASSRPPEVVNINTATAAELDSLPGIGQKRAEDIVADREKNGPFRHPEDLTRVKGIGEGTLQGLLEYITVE